MAFVINNALYPKPYLHPATTSNASGYMLQVTSTTVATSFTLANFNSSSSTESIPPPELFFMDVQGSGVTVSWSGTPLAGTNGNQLAAGTNYTWANQTLLTAQFVLTSGVTSAQLYASPFTT